ncbi:MAG: phosphotransferase [Mycobacteriales bacterium]
MPSEPELVGRGGLWPELDVRDADLNAVELSWIARTASIARTWLLDLPTKSVAGHLDWHSANLGWHEQKLVAIFDWDSVGA